MINFGSSILLLVIACGALTDVWAGSLTLYPVADAALIEVAPTNNSGGHVWVNAGTTQNGPRNRGLFRFDPPAQIPTNAVILSASVTFELTGQPATGETIPSASFGLHRMLRAWGEGTKTNGQFAVGQGQPASPGEVTWMSAFHPTNAWAAPGGQAGVDYVTFESASTFIEDVGNSPYTFGPTPELAADVQRWLNQPGTNFGWMLLCADEGVRFTARRFASREDVNNAPRLNVQYLVPPLLHSVGRSGTLFRFQFQRVPGQTYTLESREDLATGAWQWVADLGEVSQPTLTELFIELSGAKRFFRLNSALPAPPPPE